MKLSIRLFDYFISALLLSGLWATAEFVLKFIKPSLLLKHHLFLWGLILGIFLLASYNNYKQETGILDILALIVCLILALFVLKMPILLIIFPFSYALLIYFYKELDPTLRMVACGLLGIVGLFEYSMIFNRTFTPGYNLLIGCGMPILSVIISVTALTSAAVITTYFFGDFTTEEKEKQLCELTAGPNP